MAALRDSRSSCARGLLMWIVLAVYPLMSAAFANAQTLEGVLREIQARCEAVGVSPASWPNGPSGCTVAYPPDGFYDTTSDLVAAVNTATNNLNSAVHSSVQRFLVVEWVAALDGGGQSSGTQQTYGRSTTWPSALSQALGVTSVSEVIISNPADVPDRIAKLATALPLLRYVGFYGNDVDIVNCAHHSESRSADCFAPGCTLDCLARFVAAQGGTITSPTSLPYVGVYTGYSYSETGSYTTAIRRAWSTCDLQVNLSSVRGSASVYADVIECSACTPALVLDASEVPDVSPPVEATGDLNKWRRLDGVSVVAGISNEVPVGPYESAFHHRCALSQSGFFGGGLGHYLVVVDADFNVQPTHGGPCGASSSQPDSRGIAPGLADEGNLRDCHTLLGSYPSTTAPVSIATGTKGEAAVDVSIPVTGGRFEIRREYTSQTAYSDASTGNLVGKGWMSDAFRSIRVEQGTSETDVYLLGPPMHAHLVFRRVGATNEWKSDGPTTQFLRGDVQATVGTATIPVWRLSEPGGWSYDFYRDGDSRREGLLLQSRDAYGNTSTYSYYLPTSGSNARLAAIAVNETPDQSDCDADVSFTWHPGSAGDWAGKLKRIEVRRRIPTTNQYKVIESVDYLYAGEVSGVSSDVGAGADLVQVTKSVLLDMTDGSSASPTYHTEITQYRYHDGSAVGTGDERLLVRGDVHQLKSVFMPQQIEYYADRVASTSYSPTLAEAAAELLTKDDGDALEAPLDSLKVIDLAAKIVSYRAADDRVSVQFLQTSCGCSGSGSGAQGVKHEYEYTADYSTGSGQPMGLSTRVTESLSDSVGSYDTPYRITYYDMHKLGTDEVPYLVNKVIAEVGEGREWVWRTEYDSNRNVSKSYMPSATASYTPSDFTTPTAPSWTAVGTSAPALIYQYTYTTSSTSPNRLVETRVSKRNNNTTFDVVSKITYLSTTGKEHLPWKIEKFRNDNSSPGAEDIELTEFDYGFHTSSIGLVPIAWLKTTSEAGLTSENGPGGTVETVHLFDTAGRNVWRRRPDNSLVYRAFDQHTGLETQVTRNAVRTAPNGDSSKALDPAAYVGITGTTTWGLTDGELTTHTRRDLLGRVIEEIGPPGDHTTAASRGVSTYTVRQLRASQTAHSDVKYYAEVILPHELLGLTGPSNGEKFNGPAHVTWMDAAGKVIREEDRLVSTSAAYNPRDLTFTLESTTVGKRTVDLNLAGQVKSETVWDWVSPELAFTRQFKYDLVGRLESTEDADGTFTLNSSFDVLDRVLQIKVGTDTSPTTGNMQIVAEYFYDDDDIDEQGVGDGNLRYSRILTGESGSDTAFGPLRRETKYTYDNRNRLTLVTPLSPSRDPAFPISSTSYDNLDRVIAEELYTSATITSSNRGRRLQRSYNQRGLVYREEEAVDPSASSPTYLPSNRFFDATGRVVAEWSPNGPGRKLKYDGLGRVTFQYLTDGGGDDAPGATLAHAEALTLDDDTVLEQTAFRYNAAGLVDLTTHSYRTNASGSGGGGLAATTDVHTFVGTFYDDADRPIRTVDFGVNQAEAVFKSGGTAPTWPPTSAIPEWDVSPYNTDYFIVDKTVYDNRGLPAETVDSKGHRTKRIFDHRGRVVATIRNYTNLVMAWDNTAGRMTVASGLVNGESETDQATSVAYGASGRVLKEVAHLPPPPSSSDTETPQITSYVYGTTVGSASDQTHSLIASNKLVREIHHPDESSGQPGSTNAYKTKFAYNRAGEVRSVIDQNQTRRTFARDHRGRVDLDTAQALGSNISGWVRRIETTYDSLGRTATVKSFPTTSATTPNNAVSFAYTELGHIAHIDQDHNGPIELNGSGQPINDTRRVSYTYSAGYPATGSGGAAFSRMTELTYPDGEAVLSYGFGSSGSVDDRISRLASIGLSELSSVKMVKYGYVGLSMDAEVNYEAADVQLDRAMNIDSGERFKHTQLAAGRYPGWDHFGRVASDAWVDGSLQATGSPPSPTRPAIVALAYNHDRVSNRLKSEDRRPGASHDGSDWRFEYDNLDRLKIADKGHYDATPQFQHDPNGEQWDLDMLGRWGAYRVNADGSGTAGGAGSYADPGETETRSHNMANEVATRDPIGAVGSLTLVHDDNGNLTTHPRSSSVSDGFIYDAWNRLVSHVVTGSGGPMNMVTYEYNGLNWRTLKYALESAVSESAYQRRVMYYDADWRLLEERVEAFDGTSSENWVKQEYWGARRLDDPVMRRVKNETDESFGSIYYHLTDVRGDTLAMTDVGADPAILERVMYTPYGTAAHSWPRDFDGDGDEDVVDKGIVKNHPGASIGGSGYDPRIDLDRSGTIDSADLDVFNSTDIPRGPLNPGLISDPDGPDNVFGLAGAVFNAENGYTLMRYRMYEPGLGRFFQRDPLGNAGGPNRYQYVNSDPLSGFDPFGLLDERELVLENNRVMREAIARSRARGTVDAGKLDRFEAELAEGTWARMNWATRSSPTTTDMARGGWKTVEEMSLRVLDLADIALVESVNSIAGQEVLTPTPQSQLGKQSQALAAQGDSEALCELASRNATDTVWNIFTLGGKGLRDAYLESERTGDWTIFREAVGGWTLTAPAVAKAVQAVAVRCSCAPRGPSAAAVDTIPAGKRIQPFYPPNRGFLFDPKPMTLNPGTLIDRFGLDTGTFVAPLGTPIPLRALPPGVAGRPYGAFEVLKPIEVKAGPARPWFGQPGLGTQFELPMSVRELIQSGHLRAIQP
jgi:RHS repeat-associated protein